MISFSHWIVHLVYLTLFIIFLHKWYFNGSSKAQKTLPPSPARLPVIGNLHQLGLFPHRSLKQLSKRYGPLMMLHFGSVPALIVSSADAVREIVKNQDVIFSSRPKLSIMRRIVYGYKDVAFAPYGEHWRHVRSIGVLQLLSNKRVQSYRRIREEETSLMIEKIRNSSNSLVNLSILLVSLTNDIISRVVLGRKYSGTGGDQSVNFELMLKELGELLVTFNPGDFVPWLNWINRFTGLDARVEKVAKSFDEFFTHVVEEHRSGRQGKAERDGSSNEVDFVDILLEIQEDNSSSSSAIETDTIKAVIFDMFGAGTDTTYTSLEWTMAELLRHPKIMEKLQSEVRLVAGSKLEITEEDLDKMPYLKAVIKESLRLHPPLPLLLPRELTQDTTLMGYEVAAGTRVMINAWAIGRDPMVWENPEEFHPERFLDTGIDFRGLNFELIPFGTGRRGCPGITFAIGVGELALAKLMHKFNFTTQKDLDMTEAPGTAVHIKCPLLVTPTPHLAASN